MSSRINIYVPASSNTLNLMLYNNAKSIIGMICTWTNNMTSGYYVNTTRNMYIYPVANVAAIREANGD